MALKLKPEERTPHTRGRKPLTVPKDLAKMYKKKNLTELSEHYGVSRPIVVRWVKEYKEKYGELS